MFWGYLSGNGLEFFISLCWCSLDFALCHFPRPLTENAPSVLSILTITGNCLMINRAMGKKAYAIILKCWILPAPERDKSLEICRTTHFVAGSCNLIFMFQSLFTITWATRKSRNPHCIVICLQVPTGNTCNTELNTDAILWSLNNNLKE